MADARPSCDRVATELRWRRGGGAGGGRNAGRVSSRFGIRGFWYDPLAVDDPLNQSSPEPPAEGQGPGGSGDEPRVENFSHSAVAARVPERVARGIFCTGQVILDGPKEFVVDFLQGLTRPYQVVSRVVLTPATATELAEALRRNIDLYTKQFGPPPPVPGPVPQRRPTIAEIYENFRLPDDLLSGTYANSVLIGHSATEFFLDFVTGFYPTSAVAARIFLPTPQAPRFLNALLASIKQHQIRHAPRAGGGERSADGAAPGPDSR
jgi:hypothetical protein